MICNYFDPLICWFLLIWIEKLAKISIKNLCNEYDGIISESIRCSCGWKRHQKTIENIGCTCNMLVIYNQLWYFPKLVIYTTTR